MKKILLGLLCLFLVAGNRVFAEKTENEIVFKEERLISGTESEKTSVFIELEDDSKIYVVDTRSEDGDFGTGNMGTANWAFKYDKVGELVWKKMLFTDLRYTNTYNIKEYDNEIFVLGSVSRGLNPLIKNGIICKMDKNGENIEKKIFDENEVSMILDILKIDNKYYVIGRNKENSNYGISILKLDEKFKVESTKYFNGKNMDDVKKTVLLNDDIWLFGYTESGDLIEGADKTIDNTYSQKGFAIKYNIINEQVEIMKIGGGVSNKVMGVTNDVNGIYVLEERLLKSTKPYNIEYHILEYNNNMEFERDVKLEEEILNFTHILKKDNKLYCLGHRSFVEFENMTLPVLWIYDEGYKLQMEAVIGTDEYARRFYDMSIGERIEFLGYKREEKGLLGTGGKQDATIYSIERIFKDDKKITISNTSTEKVYKGNEVVVEVALENVENIYAEDFTVNFDSDYFDYVGYENVEGKKVYHEEVDGNNIRYIVANLGETNGITGTGSVLKLKFKTKKAGAGKIDVIKGKIADNDELEESILSEFCGEIIINIEEVKDVNKNGKFSLLDLAIDSYYYGKAVSETDSSKYDCDVVVDNVVDEKDLTEIVKKLLKNGEYNQG